MEEFEIETAKEKRKKKRMAMTLVFVLAVVAIVGTSFALWQLTFTQTGTNVITTGCLNLTLTDNSDAITLEDATPTADDEGKTLTPYTFTIKNTCNVNTRYVINLESVSTGTKILADQYVKAHLLKGTEEVFIDKLVESNQNLEKVIDTASAAYKLTEGMLAGQEEQQFNLRLWLDEETGPIDEVMNATWQGKITITATYVPAVTTPAEPATMKTIAADYAQDIWTQKANITKVIFENTIAEIAGENVQNFDISSDNSGSIMARLVPNADDGTKYTVHIQANGNVLANADSSNLFNGFTALTTIEGVEYLDLSGVTTASNMFNGCSNLTGVTLTIPAGLTTYDGMFTGAATVAGTTITLNYETGADTIVDAIITNSTGSNITKGTEVTTNVEP